MCRLPTIIPQPEKHDLASSAKASCGLEDVKSRVSDRWQTPQYIFYSIYIDLCPVALIRFEASLML